MYRSETKVSWNNVYVQFEEHWSTSCQPLMSSIFPRIPIGSCGESLEPFQVGIYIRELWHSKYLIGIFFISISFTSNKTSILQMKILKFREVIDLTWDHTDRTQIWQSTCLILKLYCPLCLDFIFLTGLVSDTFRVPFSWLRFQNRLLLRVASQICILLSWSTMTGTQQLPDKMLGNGLTN